MVIPYIFSNGSFDFMNFRLTFLNQLKEHKNDAKIRSKIMWAINNFTAISNVMRQIGSLCSFIIHEEIDNAIK